MGRGRWMGRVVGAALLLGSLLTGSLANTGLDCGPHGRLLPSDGKPATCEFVTPPPPVVELGIDATVGELSGRAGAFEGQARAARADLTQVSCDSGDGSYRVRAVYASDPAKPGGDHCTAVEPLIQRWAAGMNVPFQSAQKTPMVPDRLTASTSWSELGIDPAGRRVNLVYSSSGRTGYGHHHHEP